MTNVPRAELLRALAELCERYPHWRFAQLVANVAGWSDQDVWDVEDQQLLEAASSHLSGIHPSCSKSNSRAELNDGCDGQVADVPIESHVSEE